VLDADEAAAGKQINGDQTRRSQETVVRQTALTRAGDGGGCGGGSGCRKRGKEETRDGADDSLVGEGSELDVAKAADVTG